MLTVNLLPWRIQQWRHQRQQSLIMLTSAVIVSLLILLLYGWRGYLRGQQQQAEQGALTQRISQLDQQLQVQQALQQQRDTLLLAKKQQQARQSQHITWQQFWQQLPELMPDTLWLSRIERRQGQLLLEGVASGMAAISDFRRQLVTQPLFTVIRQGSVQRQPDGYYRFTLRARVQEGTNE